MESANLTSREMRTLVLESESLEAIAQELGLTPSKASEKIKRVTGQTFTKIQKKVIERKIKGLMRRRLSITDMSKRLGVNISEVSFRIKEMTGVNYCQLMDKDLTDNLALVREGKKDINDVRREFGYTPVGFYKILNDKGATDLVFDAKPYTLEKIKKMRRSFGKYRQKNIDALMDEGLPVTEIAEKVGKTRQSIDQYLIGSCQYSHWRSLVEVRKGIEEIEKAEKASFQKVLDQVRSNKLREIYTICGLDNLSIVQGDSNDTKAEKMTAKVRLSYSTVRGDEVDLVQVRRFFVDYFESLDAGKRVGYHQFAKKHSFANFGQVQSLLERAELKPLCEGPQKTDEDIKKMFELAKNSPFSTEDVISMTGVKTKYNTVRYFMEGRKNLATTPVVRKVNGEGFKRITHSGLYFLYQAQDEGLNRAEMQELFPEIHLELIEYALSERDKLEPPLMTELAKLNGHYKV